MNAGTERLQQIIDDSRRIVFFGGALFLQGKVGEILSKIAIK